jgi:hypothetical protein
LRDKDVNKLRLLEVKAISPVGIKICSVKDHFKNRVKACHSEFDAFTLSSETRAIANAWSVCIAGSRSVLPHGPKHAFGVDDKQIQKPPRLQRGMIL